MRPHTTTGNHWEERGAAGFTYRGERLYTITAAPYYLARRAAVDAEIVRELQRCDAKRILDFGCGDGSYIERLRPCHLGGGEGIWVGSDISRTMLQQARVRCSNVLFVSSVKEIPGDMRFDFVYAVTVFAHVSDEVLSGLLGELREVLEPEATGMFFEQIAPARYGRDQFVRRSIPNYCEILAASGLVVDSVKVLDWPVHRLFERSLAKFFYRYLCGRGSEYERRIAANRNPLFRSMSRLSLLLSPGVMSGYTNPCWGYAMFRFRKAYSVR